MRKLLLFLLMGATCPAATITYVQGNSGATCTTVTASAVCAMGSSVGLGDVIILSSKTAATSTPTIALSNAGTAVCSWSIIFAPQEVAAQVAYSTQSCIVSTAGTLTTTATWTGSSATRTDVSLAEYHSSTGWNVSGGGNFIAATSSVNPTPVTFCTTGATVIQIPAGFLAVAICGQFNAGQTWSGTVGAYTNRTASSNTTTGWYDTIPSVLAAQSFTTSINTDIGYGVIVAFAPNGATARGQPVTF